MTVRDRVVTIAGMLTAGVILFSGCRGNSAALTMLVDARRVAADLHVQFSRAVDQSGQAVLAESDADASKAARAAETATASVTKDMTDLQSRLDQLQYMPEAALLRRFSSGFEEYRRLESEILQLAVENTNVKAQRLTFGPAREAADAFVHALNDLAASDAVDPRVGLQAARAEAAVREIQAIEPRHNAEANDEAMSTMEAAMGAAETQANRALAARARLHPGAAGASLSAARAALDKLWVVNQEIVTLSRRNSGVRSIGLSVGRKRVLAAECDDLLGQIEEGLTGRDFPATR
jgi:hypothetical protein